MLGLFATKTTTTTITRCTVEERDLCFVCHRNEHIEGEERLWHEWETSKAYTCRICAQRDATVVCCDCADKGPSQDNNNNKSGTKKASGGGGDSGGLVLCDNCWERTHAHADVRHHRGISIDQWAARDRAMGGVADDAEGDNQGVLLLERGGEAAEEGQEEQQVALVESAGWDEGGGAYDYDYAAGGIVAYDEYAGAEQYGHEPYYES